MRALDYILFAIPTLLLGWFSIRVFTPDRWSQRERIVFTVALTSLAFLGLGVYRLSTGEDLESYIQRRMVCSIYAFAYCLQNTALQMPAVNIQTSQIQAYFSLKDFRADLQKNFEGKSTVLKNAVTDYAEIHNDHNVLTVDITSIENISNADLLDLTIRTSIWMNGQFKENIDSKLPRLEAKGRILIADQICNRPLIDWDLQSSGLREGAPTIQIPKVVVIAVGYKTGSGREAAFPVTAPVGQCAR